VNSPLAWPVTLKDNIIYVLDETRLPIEEYVKVRSLENALKVLGQMKTRAFGQVLLFFYTCAITNKIDEIAQEFIKIRPTFDFLLLTKILNDIHKKTKDIKMAVKVLLSDFEEKRRERIKNLANILPDFSKILTICNVSGELVYLYESLKNIGKNAIFYVSETRPYLQGSRLTFWELQRVNIPSKLICDNQAAIIMRDNLVNCVVTGSDRSTTKGDIINKIGTYPLAVLAKYYNIPFFSLIQYPSNIDINKIEIEERPVEEIFMWINKEDLKIHTDMIYPSFDITPSNLITARIDITGNIK
jgi:methylthioribose-1-phosphate isomerase